MRAKLDSAVISQAQAMIIELESRFPGASQRLAADAISEMGTWDEIAIRVVSENVRNDGRFQKCSISGYYRSDAIPPELIIAESNSLGRNQFTALHELGHHLQRNILTLGESVLSHNNHDKFEDAACDVFASRILIPDHIVDAIIGLRGPDVESVIRLLEKSQASLQACCVRAAERLAGFGSIVLLDSNGVVNFSVTSGLYPPAYGSSQASTSLISAVLAQRLRTTPIELETNIAYRNGNTSQTLYGQAIWCSGYIVAVLAEDHPAWQAFALPKVGTGHYALKWDGCEICLAEFPVKDRCSVCERPLCPDAHCACTIARERQCQICRLVWSIARFESGSAICFDCS